MTKKQYSVITILTLAALLLALALSNRLWFRADLSRNKAYTLSAVSRNLYKEIPDRVRITYYISDKLVAVHPMPGEIEDLLREYAAYSHGKIELVLRDPVKDKLTREAEQLGIIPQQIQTVDQGEASIATVYTGIAIEYLDKVEVIPVAFSLDTLEYDITSRIRAMVSGVERQTGILVGDAGKTWERDYNYLSQSLTQAGFRARLLAPGDEIPDTLPCLVVLGGAADLDEQTLYRIDRYIQGGGKVFFALDAVSVDINSGSLAASLIEDKGLLKMVASYGAVVKPALALDRAANTLQYQTRTMSGAMQYRIIDYPHWVAVLDRNGNAKNPVTNKFAGVDLFWPSPVELLPPTGVEADALFTTTNEAWTQAQNFVTSPEAVTLPPKEEMKQIILGAALSGTFPKYFKEKPADTLPDMPAAARTTRIIVVGDADFLSGMLQFTRGQRNLDFALKALDWLSSDDEIIGIRSREGGSGRLDRIADPARRMAASRWAQILNVAVVPAALAALGFALAWRRRKRGVK